MGLFSKIGKAIKGVFKGIGKVFKSVFKAVGKVLNSKFGKLLMMGVAIFTAGAALAAGVNGFASTSGSFLTKFVAGAKDFVAALAHPIKAAKGLLGGAGEAAAGAASAGTTAVQAAGETAANTAAATGATGASSVAGAAANPLETIAAGAAPAANAAAPAVAAAPKGFLSRAAAGVANFAKTAGGGTLIGNVVQGYGAGAQQEALLKAQRKDSRYYDEQWQDPNKVGQLQSAVRDVNVPSGYLDRARRVSEFLNNRQYTYPTQPGDPNAVADYARSPM